VPKIYFHNMNCAILWVGFRKTHHNKSKAFSYFIVCCFSPASLVFSIMSVASDSDTDSSSSSSSSSTSSHGRNSTSSHDTKWETLYALRERIVRFVAQLEKRTKLYPPPFHRCMIGGDAKIEQVSVRYSEDVSQSASEYIVGVFNDGETIDPHSSTYVCNYPGWILTQQEYTELNDETHENMGAHHSSAKGSDYSDWGRAVRSIRQPHPSVQRSGWPILRQHAQDTMVCPVMTVTTTTITKHSDL